MRCARCDNEFPRTDRFCGRCGLARSADGRRVDPLIGITVAGRYRIERRIGVGGMGTVYLGVHVRLGQRVAIKVLHERYAGDKTLIRRFEQEALTYGKVAHPNLVALHDFGRTGDGTFFMVLEYCPGVSLAALVRKNQGVDAILAADVIVQIAQGLAEAHAEGVIHRDLKPENVMLTETRPGRYHVKLLDFGIAKCIDEDDSQPRLTQAGMVFGTPEYMAPEQARGENVDPRSDIYALGAMFYELLTGKPPFTGSNKMKVMHSQAMEPPPPLASRLPPDRTVPPAIEQVLLQCLEKKPSKRFQSCKALISALDIAVGGERLTPVPAPIELPPEALMPMPVETPLPDATAAESAIDELIGITHPPAFRGPPVGALVGATLLFCGVVALAAWMFSANKPVHDEATVAITPEPQLEEPAHLVLEVAPAPEVLPKAPTRKKKKMVHQPASAKVVVAPKAPESKPVAKAPEPKPVAKPMPSVDLAKLLDKGRKSAQMGRFGAGETAADAILAVDAENADAKDLKASIAELRDLLTQGKASFARSDCEATIKTLEPVLKAAPGIKGVSHMINTCRDALPPREL